MTACVLVFLFAFHAKTGVYGGGFNVKPHTATSSKLWMKSQRTLKPPPPPSFIAYSQSFEFNNPLSGLASAQLPLVTGFAPALCFSGLSPPLII